MKTFKAPDEDSAIKFSLIMLDAYDTKKAIITEEADYYAIKIVGKRYPPPDASIVVDGYNIYKQSKLNLKF